MPHSIHRAVTIAAAAVAVCSSAIARPALQSGRVRVGSLHLGARRIAADAKPSRLIVTPHEGAHIEWWYVNAHVTTEHKRHLAVVGAFFRLGNGHAILNPAAPQQRSHYLIYAVTDLDARKQRAYSFADSNMIDVLKQIAPFMAALNPSDAQMRKLVASLNDGRLPEPHRQLAVPARVDAEPFKLAYGDENSLADSGVDGATFDLDLGGGTDKVNLRLTGTKPPMPVGGKGETGLAKPTDMYYFSLTRCAVSGTVDTGAGPEQVVKGEGWFDHQWGSSWVAQNDGWDWWGAQLSDGSDVLFFRQRSLATGNTFFPMATFMDKSGHVTVTRNIQFQPDPRSLWKSPATGVRYPLSWIVTFPDQHLRLQIAATVKSQEIPILGPGSAIWEGCCSVYGLKNIRWRDMSAEDRAQMALTLSKDPVKRKVLSDTAYKQNMLVTRGVNGIAYMELVGYNSPAVKAHPLGIKAPAEPQKSSAPPVTKTVKKHKS
jgi:predicted secreted hydrolase